MYEMSISQCLDFRYYTYSILYFVFIYIYMYIVLYTNMNTHWYTEKSLNVINPFKFHTQHIYFEKHQKHCSQWNVVKSQLLQYNLIVLYML